MIQLKQNDVVEIRNHDLSPMFFSPNWCVSYDVIKSYSLYCPYIDTFSESHRYHLDDIKSNIGIVLFANIGVVETQYNPILSSISMMSHLILVGDQKFIIPEMFLEKL